jgi:peptidylprolyl isomerase
MKQLFLALTFALAVLTPAAAQQPPADPQNTIYLETKDGRITIRLRPDLAPKHAEQIKALTKRGFYNGIVFHRVIPGFMAQTGDPTGTRRTRTRPTRSSSSATRAVDRSPASTRSSARSCPAWT